MGLRLIPMGRRHHGVVLGASASQRVLALKSLGDGFHGVGEFVAFLEPSLGMATAHGGGAAQARRDLAQLGSTIVNDAHRGMPVGEPIGGDADLAA